jgi:gliding motility-associated-like protein
MKRILILFLALLNLCVSSIYAQENTAPVWSAEYSKSKSFIENLGQFDEHENASTGKIRYAVDFGATRIFFGDKGVSYSFLEATKIPKEERDALRQKIASSVNEYKQNEKLIGKFLFKSDVVNMTWKGSSNNASLIGEQQTSDYHNYSYTNENGVMTAASAAKGFKKIIYKNIYPNTDIEYTVHPQIGIKYAVILHPGADVEKVQMLFDRDLSIIDGKLNIPTFFGAITDHAPITFYEGSDDDYDSFIRSSFTQEQRSIGFSVDTYDHSETLIIDPWTQTPAFNTNWDVVWECERDAAGNVYILGGIMPMQILKYNATGTLQWTYNTPYDTSNVWLGTFAVDNAGNSYVTAGSVAQIQKVSPAGAMLLNNASPGGIISSAEFWNIAFNCDQTSLIIGGTGGALLQLDAVIYNVNTSTLNISNEQFISTGQMFSFPPNLEEVRSITSAPNGKYYFITHDTIGYINDNFTLCPAGTTSFFKNNHGMGLGYKCEDFRYDNAGIMAIRADANAVYVHRGNQLQKRSLTTGAILGTVAIPGGAFNNVFLGGNQVTNSGIDIDNCGNIYVGSQTGVYKFNSNLVQQAFYATAFRVYDVEVNSGGEIIACGGTGTSTNTSRSGGVQTFAASACVPIASTCCDATICIPQDVCVTDAPFTLTSATSGGTWSGTGVSATGVFNPATAGVGTETVTYTLACGSETITINVNACANLTVCQETNGQFTVSGGSPNYTWSQGTTTTTTTTPANAAECIACGGTPQYIPFFNIYNGCTPTQCTNTTTTWTAFGTGATQTITTYPVQITDGNGTVLVLTSAAGILPCNSNPCPTINVSATTTPVSCFAGSNGAATATATGGAANYTYTWTPGGLSGATQNNLTAGTYTVNVTDANNCPGSTTVTITQPATALSVNVAATPTSCGGNTGTASATATGGTTTYSYAWTPNAGSGATISNLAAGTYSVVVTDANGCTANGNTTVNTNNGPSISLVNSSNVTCFGASNGSATVAGTGGTGTLTYTWTPGALSGTTQTALAPNTYTVTVSDAGGCTNSTTVTITSPTAIVVTTSNITPANCGVSNGSATIAVTGGTGTYTYNWLPTGGSGLIASNIPAGVYAVNVQDQNGCTATGNVVVTNVGGPTVSISNSTNVSCFGGNNGSATVTASGGSVPYSYAWTPSGGSGATATGLTAGTYTVAVTDAAGCISSATATITAPNAIAIAETITNDDCANQGSGQISIVASNGTAPYSYSWSNSASGATISGLVGNTSYTVTVTDANGCSAAETYPLGLLGNLNVVASASPTTVLQGETAQLNATGATTYSWTPAANLSCVTCATPIATPSTTTTYIVTGIDPSGCTGVDTVTVYVQTLCGDLYIPTAFSPNSSGPAANNTLCIYGNCITSLNYAVYDRWGEKVFETTEVDQQCWDGTFRGKELNTGIYAYKIRVTLTDGTYIEESGNLNLLR